MRERFASLTDKNDAEMPLSMRNYVLLGVGLAVIYDRHVEKNKKTVHTLVGYPHEGALKTMEKGDNHLD